MPVSCRVVLQTATVDFQGFPATIGKSVRHARDMQWEGFMRKFGISITSAAMVAAQCGTSIADAQFATVESFYSQDGQMLISSLRATADQVPIDGQYQFEGYALFQGRQVPLTVSVPAEPVAVASFSSTLGSISQTHTFAFKAGDIEVTKVFYDVKGEQQSGSMTVTDDPLPAVAWLIIAGAAAILVPLGVYVAQGCEKISTKTTFTKDGVSYETSCEN
jgi:hypothetical protein